MRLGTLNCDLNQPRGIIMKTKALATRLHLLAASILCLASSAYAQTDAGRDALYVQSLAATCAQCHGTNGVAVAGSSITSLAGLDKAYTVAQMKAFKAGARPATIMHQLSKGYSDAQIEVLATYFAAQKK
jgi:cytochrome c553